MSPEVRQTPATGPATALTASVIICAYTTKRWALLESAVESVLAQDPPSDEVILVVDHHPELEAAAQRRFTGRGVRVIPSSGAPGLSGARNTGASVATGDVVLFLDDDASARPGWLRGHLRHYEDPQVIGVGGSVHAQWSVRAPAWFPPEFLWVVGCSYVGQPTVTAEVRNPIGANMSFRRCILDRVGGFSTGLGRVGTAPRGCEETELSIRARQVTRGRILHEPDAAVDHHVSPDRARVGYFTRRCWSEGLSKADVSRLTDPGSALATERSYVLNTLGHAAVTNAGDAVRLRDPSLAARTALIALGLLTTAAGYATGRATAVAGAALTRDGRPDVRWKE